MPNQFFSPEGDLENYFVTEYWLIDQWVGDTLWVWGGGGNGQLGNNTTTTVYTPVTTFSGGVNWSQISLSTHSAAIKTDGTLWVWGYNSYGQLGINNTISNPSTPVTTILGGTGWKQVSAGGRGVTYGLTGAIKTDGTLWLWGRNSYGTIGNNNTTTPVITPVTTFAGGTNWEQVSCGGRHVLALKTDGTLWTWGRNAYGELGDNTTVQRLTPVTTFTGGNNWKQISAGIDHSMAVKTDGTLWVWGRGLNGRLGLGGGPTFTNQSRPQVLSGTNWRSCSAGTNHSAAIKNDGTLWLWGAAGDGQLANNSTTPDIATPVTTFSGGTNWKQVELGYRFSSALKTDGTLWTWGVQALGGGNLGINVNGGQRNTPVTIFLGGTNWKQVVSGEYTMNALTSGIELSI